MTYVLCAIKDLQEANCCNSVDKTYVLRCFPNKVDGSVAFEPISPLFLIINSKKCKNRQVINTTSYDLSFSRIKLSSHTRLLIIRGSITIKVYINDISMFKLHVPLNSTKQTEIF